MQIKKIKDKNLFKINSNFGTFFSSEKNLKKNFYSKILLIEGLGYEIFFSKKKKYLLIKIGYSHLYAIKIPSNISFYFITSKKLLFLSQNKEVLSNWLFKIKNLKKKNSYKKKGFFFENEKIILKKGKSLK